MIAPVPAGLLDALDVAAYATDADGRITAYNIAAITLWGWRPPIMGKWRWCGSWRLFQRDGTALPHAECPMAVAMREGRAIGGAKAVAERPDGVRIPFLAYPMPLRDDTGSVVGGLNVLIAGPPPRAADSGNGPAFTEQEHARIAAWAEAMRPRGLRTELDRGHEVLDEALYVSLAGADEPRWLVHKTPAGAVAVRIWPGVATIVAELGDALAIIAAASPDSPG